MTGIFFILLALACFYDVRDRRIPNLLVYSGMLLGVGSHLVFGIFGLLAGGALLFTLSFVLESSLGDYSIGGGDIKLMAMIGAFLGPQAALIISLVTAAVAVCILIESRFMREKVLIPFAPFMAFITVLYLGAKLYAAS